MKRTLLTIALASGVAAISSAQMAYAVEWSSIISSSNFFSIDSSNGTATVIGNTGLSSLNSLTWHNGNLVTANDTGFYSLNTSTGAVTLLGQVSGGNYNGDNRGLASMNGTLYTAVNSGTGGAFDGLYAIDPGAGTATFIGSMNNITIQSLAVVDNTMYAWSIDDGLMTVDTATGLATDVSATAGIVGIQSMYMSNGTMYGVGGAGSYSIDLVTGDFVQVSAPNAGWSDFRGAESVPEPMTLSLLGLLLLKRRKKQAS